MLISFAALILSLVAARAADQKIGQGPQAGDVACIRSVWLSPDRGEARRRQSIFNQEGNIMGNRRRTAAMARSESPAAVLPEIKVKVSRWVA